MATTGSCCGHGVSRAWISMRFEDPRTLNDFINIFEPYKYKIDLTTEEKLHPHADRFNGKPYFPRYTEMSLYTKEIGEPAYLILDELDEYLKRIIDVRTKSYDILDEMITQETIMQRRHQKDTSN